MTAPRTRARTAAVAQRDYSGFSKIFANLARSLLDLANSGMPRQDFLRVLTPRLLDQARSDAFDMWIQDGTRFYQWTARSGEPLDYHLNIAPMVTADPVRDTREGERRAHFDPRTTVTTASGNIVTGGPPASRSRRAGGRGAAGSDPYPARVLISFAIDDQNAGLLQLKSTRRDAFTAEQVEFFEGFAQTLGVATANRRAQHALNERIKELTCMYGISTVAAQTELTLEQMLARIVALLPPAWQYPDIASARISYDGSTYASPHFAECACRLQADIRERERVVGSVEVCYSEWRPDIDNEPFLPEERTLLDAVAREVAFLAERKAAEAEQERLREQIRHADRLATIGQLTAGVAHELNEPMSNILGFAQLALESPKVPKQARRDIEKLIAATLYSREIIKKLMIFSRQAPARMTHCDLNVTITEAFTLFESRCEKEGIAVVRRLAADLPEIYADPSQMQQVLVNLVVNAIAAMPSGGVLTIATAAKEDSVLMSVEDTGVGMTADVMKKIFMPFFTTKEVGQGTGLGLSVVHGIVSAHGGSVDVSSTPGRGSRFTVRLPTTDRERQEQA